MLKYFTVYIGSINSSAVRVGEIFKESLKQNAAAIIVAHNHPSGDPTPSPEDVAVTREIVEAGKLLGVDVLDHLVIGQGRWVSLREPGLSLSEVRDGKPLRAHRVEVARGVYNTDTG